MDCNTALNAACDFNGYFVCQMPADTVEMELKIKTTRGKLYTTYRHLYEDGKVSSRGQGGQKVQNSHKEKESNKGGRTRDN